MNLAELIDTHRGGRSYPELSRACGGSPSDKRLQQLVRGEIKNFPDPPTVRALAKGLRVSQEAVLLAAAESLGLDVRSSLPRLVELLPADARDLTEEQAAAIAHLVRTIVQAEPARTRAPDPDVVAWSLEGDTWQIEVKAAGQGAHLPGVGIARVPDMDEVDEALKQARSYLAAFATDLGGEVLEPIEPKVADVLAYQRRAAEQAAAEEERIAARNIGGPSRGQQRRQAIEGAGEEPQGEAPEGGA